ncbi:uncharacterized protein LOC136096454 [Hydra vulgaris]|uniref:uncharacterized protein LOC136096454 n=1 Tax=Hydra vulgaris TaxID=6087 RepID=UPI0032E9C1B8
MGKSDHCAIFGCNNDRRYKEKYVLKDHIYKTFSFSELKFFTCKEKYFSTWSKIINREIVDPLTKKRKLYAVNKNTKVCANHFEYGKPTELSPHPKLYLKGYEISSPQNKRKLPIPRYTPTTVSKKHKNTHFSSTCTTTSSSNNNDNIPQQSSLSISPPCLSSTASNQQLSPQQIDLITNTPATYLTPTTLYKQSSHKRLTWEAVRSLPKVIKLYTGCPTENVFLYIVSRVQAKHKKVSYFMDYKRSFEPKQYQFSPASKPSSTGKPGPARQLFVEDEVLLTLMRIRLDSPLQDLAFRFKISVSHVSRILTTFITLLARELEPLIYWPAPEETLSFTHPHFIGDFVYVEGIGDCTEQTIQKPANAKAQYQTYSSYKSRNTLKKLIFCTKGGSISFVSKGYSGSSSDRFITKDCNVARRFTPGFIALFDKGFNVQDLFLSRQVKAVIPPFLRSKRQFTPSEVYHCKRIARARIHIERVIGRLKEFRLLKNTLPITLVPQFDDIWIIAAAIVNLQPPLVKATAV